MNANLDFIPIKQVKVVKLDAPIIVNRKDKDNVPYTVELNYKVDIKYPGTELSQFCTDLDHVLATINKYRTYNSPSWETVTCNGRWSCD